MLRDQQQGTGCEKRLSLPLEAALFKTLVSRSLLGLVGFYGSWCTLAKLIGSK